MIYLVNRKTKVHRAPTGRVGKDEDITQADADGWIQNPGYCPLPDGQPYEIRLRSGQTYSDRSGAKDHGVMWENDMEVNYIVAYRPILEEPKPTQWRGPEDGLPPIGCTVGVTFPGMAQDRFEVLAHNKEKAVVFCRKTEMAMSLSANDLKPIRTPEEIAEERAVEAMYDYITGSRAEAVALYAAIRDGRIPGVKLESQ